MLSVKRIEGNLGSIAVTLKFVVFNARSVRNKAREVSDFIAECESKFVDIIETCLSNNDQASINEITSNGF